MLGVGALLAPCGGEAAIPRGQAPSVAAALPETSGPCVQGHLLTFLLGGRGSTVCCPSMSPAAGPGHHGKDWEGIQSAYDRRRGESHLQLRRAQLGAHK